MGFTDVELNRKMLYKTNGNVQQAIELITNPTLKLSKEGTPKQHRQVSKFLFPKLPVDQAEKVLQIAQLGFTDEGKIRHALYLKNWNTEQAIEVVLEDGDSLQSNFSAMVQNNHSLGMETSRVESTVPTRPLATIPVSISSVSDPFAGTFEKNSRSTKPKSSKREIIPHSSDIYGVRQSNVFAAKQKEQEIELNPFDDDNATSNRQKIQEFDPFADSNKL
jgi:hypothetical protein